ncbi:PEP-CTERM sorting domain-containing protein [Planctomycetota bacterium]
MALRCWWAGSWSLCCAACVIIALASVNALLARYSVNSTSPSNNVASILCNPGSINDSTDSDLSNQPTDGFESPQRPFLQKTLALVPEPATVALFGLGGLLLVLGKCAR